MEQTFDKKRYAGFIHVVQVIVKVLMIILFVLLGVLAIGFLVILFIPKNALNVDLSQINNYQHAIITAINEIDPSILDRVVNIKRVLLMGSLMALLNMSFAEFVLFEINKLLKNVKEEPFKQQNSHILKVMAYGFFAASIVLSIVSTILASVVINTIDIVNVRVSFRLNWQFIFIGVLLFILGYVFSYGSYLQEEHDTIL